MAQSKPNRRPKADVSTSSQKPENLRSRRAKTTSIKAAMELKARRLNTDKTVVKALITMILIMQLCYHVALSESVGLSHQWL